MDGFAIVVLALQVCVPGISGGNGVQHPDLRYVLGWGSAWNLAVIQLSPKMCCVKLLAVTGLDNELK